MPAEWPQGIGPLYVSYPQFASQNCNFSHPQWKSSLLTALFSVPSVLLTLCPLCEIPSFFSPKNQTAQSKLCRWPASCSLFVAIGYLSASKPHSPKIPVRPRQFQPQFPTLTPLVPSPNQRRFNRFPAHPIHKPQLLSDRQALFHNGHATLRANIHCVSFGAQGFSALFPFHDQLHPRIQPSPRPHMRVP